MAEVSAVRQFDVGAEYVDPRVFIRVRSEWIFQRIMLLSG